MQEQERLPVNEAFYVVLLLVKPAPLRDENPHNFAIGLLYGEFLTSTFMSCLFALSKLVSGFVLCASFVLEKEFAIALYG